MSAVIADVLAVYPQGCVVCAVVLHVRRCVDSCAWQPRTNIPLV